MSAAAGKEMYRQWWFFIAALLFIVAVVERVYGIDRQSLWSDELYAVIASYKPFAGAWRMMVDDSHPPGYLSFMYATLPITGYSDFGVRLHALLFGLLWTPLVFWLTRRWFSMQAALLASAVIASAYNAVYYSQEARAYSMLMVFNILNIFCFLEILFSEKACKWHRVGFILSATAMLYLHYSGFVFLSAEMLLCGLMWLARFRLNIKELCIIFSVPLLLYSPWLGVMYANLVDAPRNWATSAVPTAQESYYVLQRLLAPDDGHMKFHCWALAAIVLCAAWQHWRQGLSQQLRIVYCLIFLMIVPVLAFYVESLVATPLFEKRYFLVSIMIEAVLVGWVGMRFFMLCSEALANLLTIAAVFIYTVWTINANVAFGLYSNLDKDPVREAVAIIKNDLRASAEQQPYSVIMTHDWFEHYLRQDGVEFDKDWPARRYYVAQNFWGVSQYFEQHKDKEILYYLALREPNTETALVPLKMKYRLLSKAAASIEAGSLDVYKFALHERPDAEQLKAVGSNRSNDLVRSVADDIGAKDPTTYHILTTHNMIRPYLDYNNIVVPQNWDGSYVINAQADSVYRYVQQHPSIDTLYYFALQEPNAEGAELMLQMRYRLLSEASVETAVGKLSVLKYSVKEPPVIDDSAKLRAQAGPTHQAVVWLQQDIGQATMGTVAVAAANDWVETYLKLGGIPIDEAWAGRRYTAENEKSRVLDYIQQHPAVSDLYYVALRQPTTEQAAAALQKTYALKTQTVITVPVGEIVIYKFSTKEKPMVESAASGT